MAHARRDRYSPAQQLVPSTLRDFSGGLNNVDNEQNLDLRYQVALSNMYRAAGGELKKRYGTRLFAKVSEAVALPVSTLDPFYGEFAASTTTTLVINRALHGMTTGQTITFAGFTEAYNGIPFASLNTTHTVTVIDPDRISITIAAYTATSPTAFTAFPSGVTYAFPGDTLNGDIIAMQYYNSRIVVVTDEAEIGTVTGAGTIERIWPNPSTALFDVNNTQANGALTFSITVGSVVSVTTFDVSAATDGTTLAAIINAELQSQNTDVTATWSSDVLTITDAYGRTISAGSLVDGGGEIDASITYNNTPLWTNPVTYASMAEFGGDLYICNGVDKPLLVDSSFSCDYVVDLGTSSNSNTPVCRYVCAADGYLLMAGDPTAPSTLYISETDAGGTWEGDAGSDAISIDLSKKGGTSVIKGITRFRDKVIVAFEDKFVVVTLGIFNSSGDHEPDTSDTIDNNGSIAHKTMISTGDELLLCDNSGVPSVAQALFTGTLRPKRASYLVAPPLKADLRPLSEATLEDRVFAVNNGAQDQYMLFIPNGNTVEDTTETTCWVYTTNPSEKINHWSVFNGWNFRSGCTSKLGRVFFSQGDEIYVYGSESDPINADYINKDDDADGDAIAFEAVWPWTDFGERTNKKKMRYVKIESTGTSRFTLKTYVDNITVDADGADNPTLSMEFVGGSSGGYGNGSQPYGGGRRSGDERAWRWKSDCNIAKMAITGSSREPLALISISILRVHAGMRR